MNGRIKAGRLSRAGLWKWAAFMALAVAVVGLPRGATIAAEAHSAALPGITLLPPIGIKTAASGAFDPDIDLRIDIFALSSDTAVGSALGPSFSVAKSAHDQIKVHGAKGQKAHYHANWKTKDSRRPDGSVVRVEIRLPSAPAGPACNAGVSLAGGCIAYFDAGLTKGKKGLPLPAGVMALTNGETLPIKLHIAEGALDAPPSEASQLPGEPGSAATAAIPDLDFDFNPEDYAPHPDLGGLMVSFRTLYLVFKLDTTVAQANQLLADIHAEIIGGLTGTAGAIEGILYVRVATASHSGMDALIDRLMADPRVEIAVQDSLLESLEIPKLGGEPNGWSWEVQPAGDNWGLEAIRVPQLWNLNRAIDKSGHDTVTGVLDVGFFNNEDVVYARDLATGPGDDHGTHVAGTVAATYDNTNGVSGASNIGVTGVNPFAELVIEDTDGTAVWGMANFFDQAPDLEVVNVSLGNNWYLEPAVDPMGNVKAQKIVQKQAALLKLWSEYLTSAGRKPPLIVAAAGNDSNAASLGNVDVTAKWSSMFTYAGLELDLPFIIVVEAVKLDANGDMTRAPFSNLYGDISAPGVNICSTASRAERVEAKSCGGIAANEPYMRMSGTSMAAPHVTGVASYLLGLDPTLTPAELKGLLMDGAGPAIGGASKVVDGFASALLIDKLRGNSSVLKRLLDIDDGSPDGDLRQECWSTCTEVTDEDIDADSGIGDGAVDMSDFRRWRDWFLLANGAIGLALDGSSSNPKTDVNRNGFPGPPEDENVYPDGDFNGDGKLDLDARQFVPGYINAEATDLEVLQALFADPDYSASDLPDLIYSADIHVDPAGCLLASDVTGVQTKIFDAEFGSLVAINFDRTTPAQREYTLPHVRGGYIVKLEAFDDGGRTVGIAQDSFPAAIGSDSWFAPRSCGLIGISPREFKVTLNAGETKTESVHLTSAGLPANWRMTGSVANVEPSVTEGVLSGEDEVTIDLIFTCPDTPGRFQGNPFLLFTDRNGFPIELSTPNWLNIDFRCLEGGVVADPLTVTMDMPMGQSNSTVFQLANKGTELLYDTRPEERLSITDNATGLLPTSGSVFVRVEATCPMSTGRFSRDVELTFENADGRPVTVDVPEKITVVFVCTGPLELVGQIHETSIGFETYDSAWEQYWSSDRVGTAQYHRRIEVDENVTRIDETPEPLGWGNWTSALDLSREIVVPPDLPEYLVPFVRPGTLTGNASMAYHSSYDGTTATWGADFSFDYTTSRRLLNPDIGEGEFCGTRFTPVCSGLGASTTTYFEIAPNTQQNLVITWTCGKFGSPPAPVGSTFTNGRIVLRRIGIGFPDIFPTENAEGCRYETVLGPGEWALWTTLELTAGAMESATTTGSYSVTLTYIPPAAP